MTTEKRTLVVGDTHGHYDRLEALLRQEKVLLLDDDMECYRNPDLDVRVIHIGDIMHVGAETGGKDREILNYAYRHNWIDDFLWGNHDRAIVDRKHIFSGFAPPFPEVSHMIAMMIDEDRWHLATSAHGFLLTHAGLADGFKGIPDTDDPAVVAQYLNSLNNKAILSDGEPWQGAVINAVSQARGGRYPLGGILWRDMSEDIDHRYSQIFGHTAQTREGVTFHREDKKAGTQWLNIDIGGKSERRLAGVWLPEFQVVRVDLA